MTLQYGVSHMSGSVTFEVRADGTASYQTSGGREGKKALRATVTPAEMTALADVLRKHRFCSLTSGRSQGVPDEARPSVRARIEDIDCRVQLWDEEWRDDANAKACLDAVEAVGRALAGRGVGE